MKLSGNEKRKNSSSSGKKRVVKITSKVASDMLKRAIQAYYAGAVDFVYDLDGKIILSRY